LIPKIIIHIK